MKHLLIALTIFMSGCISASEQPKNVELTGKLLGSYVSTSSGLLKGNILHLNDTDSIQKVSAVGSGNPNKVLLNHDNPDTLAEFAGKAVKISGELSSKQSEMFHTDFVLNVQEITEQK